MRVVGYDVHIPEEGQVDITSAIHALSTANGLHNAAHTKSVAHVAAIRFTKVG